MPTFQLLPDAKRLNWRDGRSIAADSHGRVHVDESMAREIRGSAAMHRYDAILEVVTKGGRVHQDDYVHDCGFAPWRWQATCPRCGEGLPADREG